MVISHNLQLATFFLFTAVSLSSCSICQTVCNNGGTKDPVSNYCHCPVEYYGRYCQFKHGSRCHDNSTLNCKGTPFPFCFESELKNEGYDCSYCPLGTDWNCDITDPRFVDLCNKPENQCQGNAICRVEQYDDQLISKCVCTKGRGGRLCQFDDPCRDNPCGKNEECIPVPTDRDNGRICAPCRLLYQTLSSGRRGRRQST